MIPSNPPPDSAEEGADVAEVPEFDWSVLRQEAIKTATDNSVIDKSVLSVSLVLRRNISALLCLTNVERVGYAASFIILLRSGSGQQLYSIAGLPLAVGIPVAPRGTTGALGRKVKTSTFELDLPLPSDPVIRSAIQKQVHKRCAAMLITKAGFQFSRRGIERRRSAKLSFFEIDFAVNQDFHFGSGFGFA